MMKLEKRGNAQLICLWLQPFTCLCMVQEALPVPPPFSPLLPPLLPHPTPSPTPQVQRVSKQRKGVENLVSQSY